MRKYFLVLTFVFTSLIAFAAQPIKVGSKAPLFSLKGVDGKTVSLSDYNNSEGVILIFSCNTCPVVVAYEDRIIDLEKQFAPKGFPVVAINSNDPAQSPGDSFDEMKKRATDKGFSFPYLFDADQSVVSAYGASRTPEVFILKKTDDGFVVAYTGAIDDNSQNAEAVDEKFVANAVNALLEGTNPNPNTTKAVGCGIKFKK